MEIKWLGDTTFIVSSNISTILIEPSDAILKSRLKEHNLICLNYNEHNRVKQQIDYNLFSGPGEYESGGISIKGVATNGTTDASEKMINTIFNVIPDIDINDEEKLGCINFNGKNFNFFEMIPK